MALPTDKRVAEVRDTLHTRDEDVSRVFPWSSRNLLIDAAMTGGPTEIVRSPDGSIDHVIVSPGRVRAIAQATEILKQRHPNTFQQPSRHDYVRK